MLIPLLILGYFVLGFVTIYAIVRLTKKTPLPDNSERFDPTDHSHLGEFLFGVAIWPLFLVGHLLAATSRGIMKLLELSLLHLKRG